MKAINIGILLSVNATISAIPGNDETFGGFSGEGSFAIQGWRSGSRMMDYPTAGPVRVKLKAYAVIPEGKGPPRMRVRIGLRADTYVTGGSIGEDVDVWATEEEPGVNEFTGRLECITPMLESPPNFPGLLVNVHNIYDDGSPWSTNAWPNTTALKECGVMP